MFSENIYVTSMTVAAELLKTLQRDVPFETEEELIKAHTKMTERLCVNYSSFREAITGAGNNPAQPAEVPKTVPAEVAPAKNEAVLTTPGAVKSETAVLAMVEKAVEAVTTKEGCEELKAKVLKATKLSLQDQSALIAKLDAKIKVM